MTDATTHSQILDGIGYSSNYKNRHFRNAQNAKAVGCLQLVFDVVFEMEESLTANSERFGVWLGETFASGSGAPDVKSLNGGRVEETVEL